MTVDQAPRPQRIGLIGFGGSGRVIGVGILAGAAGPATLTGVLIRDRARYVSDPALESVTVVDSLEALLATDPEVVVDAGGHETLRAYGATVLRTGRSLVSINVGALADEEVLAELSAAAEASGARVLVPSGAIAGLDGLQAASLAGLDSVTHTVRKPPQALLSTEEADAVVASGRPRVLYEGAAREAVRRFPANVNVVAAVSLAGLGLDRTHARVIADPSVTHNTHEIEATGAFGRLSITIQNVPGPNPKTGLIVGPSVLRTLQRLTARVVLGA